MEQFFCPLCRQTVTKIVFEKITGVWEEKEKRLASLKNKEKALLQREQKLLENFNKERKLIAEKANAKFQAELNKKTIEFNKSIQKEKLVLRQERNKIQNDFKKKLVSETNRLMAIEKLKQEHIRSELREKFEKQAKEKIKKANTVLDKDKMRFEQDKRIQQNRYNQLNKQYVAMQNKSTSDIQQREAKIKYLEEQLKQNQTPSELGLLNEKEMLKVLQEKFPNDKFFHTGKGEDIVHHVVSENKVVGILVYELKKVSNFSNKHIVQTAEAKQQRNADYAVLVTNAKRTKNDFGFSTTKGIIIVHPAGAVTLISILREHLLMVSKLNLSNKQRDETTKAVLEYIQSPTFKNGIESIITNTEELYGSLRKEVKEHVHIWQDRIKRYNDINNKAFHIENKVIKLAISKNESKRLRKGTEMIPIELPAEIK